MVNNEPSTPLMGELKLMDSTRESVAESPKEPVIEQARSEEPSLATEEKTSEQKQNPSDFNSGSKKARQMGETRKALAKTLIEAAKTSPTAAEALKATVSKDTDLERYLKKHWSKDYAEIIEGRTVEPEETVSPEVYKVQAKAEILAEQLRQQKREDVEDYAEELGFTRDETEELIELANKLEGTKLGGVTLDFDQAKQRAAYAIRGDKARAAGAITNLPSGTGHETAQRMLKQEEVNSLADKAKKLSGRSKEQITKNLETVEQNLKGNIFTLPM